MILKKIHTRNGTSAPARMIVSATLTLSILLLPALAANKPTYHVLHKFTGGNDGGFSAAGLIRDAQGNLYGTTEYGGAFGYGTVFKLDPSGKETVLHAFAGGDGMWPAAALLQDSAGNLYGTARNGGTPEGGNCTHGCGTVFKIDSAGKYTVLYAFTGKADGGDPEASVILDPAGNLYGTTLGGGYSGGSCTYFGGCGVVFKLDRHGKETVLHTFMSGADGGLPSGGLIRDNAGNLYGATYLGTVFKVDSTGQEAVLCTFTGGTDGGGPEGPLVRDDAGNLYGAASIGGDLSACDYGSAKGCGVVFRLDSSGNETVLYAFTGGSDQAYPNGGLLRDGAGDIYGTTGGFSKGCGYGFCGTLFKLAVNGKEHVLHSFASNGIDPFAGVIMDHTGNLYGTASQGGDSGCFPWNSCGVVFKWTP